MRVLITGGLGYVGSQVSHNLLQKGYDVSIIDIFKSNPFKKIMKAKYAQLDVSNRTGLKSYFEQNKFDQIIHLAAKKSVIESVKFPKLYMDVNVQGTRNLLEFASSQGCSNFFLASSAAVYAESESGLVSEDSDLAPANPYGESKLESEMLVNKFVSQGKIKGCSLRLFNISGEGESGLATSGDGSLIPTIASKIRNNEPIQIFGNNFKTKDGSAARDYIHVLDVSNCFSLASHLAGEREIPITLNIGTGQGTTVFEMIEQFKISSLTEISIQMESERVGEIGKMVADVRKSVEHLGSYVKHNLESIVTSSLRATL